jgi:hypothetical protein
MCRDVVGGLVVGVIVFWLLGGAAGRRAAFRGC